jgi:hypothetical protein
MAGVLPRRVMKSRVELSSGVEFSGSGLRYRRKIYFIGEIVFLSAKF